MSVELIGGHCPSIQHLPIGPLKDFGTNPYGEPIFRVVWSESRYYLVGANHREYDGDPSNDKTVKQRQKDPNLTREQKGYKWLPLYPGQPRWVLEMWKSPLGFTGCTPDQWELLYRDPLSNLLTLGPYPSRGEYCQCSVNLSRQPSREEVIKSISLVKAGWNYSFSQNQAANREALEKSEKDKFNTFQDMFKDSQQAFKNCPTNIRPGKKTADKVQMRYSAEQLRLKRRKGFSTGTPRGGSNGRNNRTA